MNNLNEEEKKALEILETEGTKNHYLEVQIVLYLINKQQKEIEELKKKNKRYEKYMQNKDKKCEDLLEFVEKEKDYISKDKIRELIKEKAKTDTYNFKTVAVKDIEELLEE